MKRAALAVLLLAAALRLAGLDWGLPHTYNADEPHIVNSAVSLGPSFFRPVSFKYPTLWPTLLSFAYGLWFLVWSVLGLRKGVVDFIALYAFEPTSFYLIARALALLASLGALLLVARAESDRDPKRWPWGALALCFSPVLVEISATAKPDSLMLLLVSAAWLCALRFQAGAKRGWLFGAAVCSGLAASTQYTAAPAALVVPLAALLRRGGPASRGEAALALALVPAAFLIGTPYAVVDAGRFLADWGDHLDLARLRPLDAAAMAETVARNAWNFGGEGAPYGAAALLGLAVLLKKDARRAVMLLVPILAYFVLLSRSTDGGWARYLFGAYPALALLASEGLALLGGKSVLRRGVVAAAFAAPALLLSARWARAVRLPDTRVAAEAWIEAEIPEGDTVLLDMAHASPRVLMSVEQVRDLAERTERAGSPRARLYRAMEARHPGGGRRVLRVQRTARDLFTLPGHAAKSQAEGDFLDVRPGLDPARAARVGWVVTSSYGADPRKARELATFFSELAEGSDLVKEFPVEPGLTAGPWLRVHRLKR
ncbi:MAG: hypothetical protein SF051_14265 [Elusimicrobiota bacterium]|nr:hypothetical protein [Elusimicrobiota bacterium]